MSDDTKDFHDEWIQFLNEEELEEIDFRGMAAKARDLGGNIGAKSRTAGRAGAAAAGRAGKALKKQFTTGAKTAASQVGLGKHSQLSFADQEKAWSGMQQMSKAHANPETINKQIILANLNNLPRLDKPADWYITLKTLEKTAGPEAFSNVLPPSVTMDGLLYWWKGRSKGGNVGMDYALKANLQNLESAWKDPEVELAEDQKTALITPGPHISQAGAIDTIVLGYLNQRYKGKSYAAIQQDFRTGRSELLKALRGGPNSLYNPDGRFFGGEGANSKPYAKPSENLTAAALAILSAGASSNASVEEPPSEEEQEAETPTEKPAVPRAAENFDRILQRETENLLSSAQTLDEKIRLPKKKCPKTPTSKLAKEFILQAPNEGRPNPLVSLRKTTLKNFDTIPPLIPGLEAIVKSQAGQLTIAHRDEAKAAIAAFVDKLKVAMEGEFNSYVHLLTKLWKEKLDLAFKKYVKLRRKADLKQCKEKLKAAKEKDTEEELGDDDELLPLAESIENKWKRLALT